MAVEMTLDITREPWHGIKYMGPGARKIYGVIRVARDGSERVVADYRGTTHNSLTVAVRNAARRDRTARRGVYYYGARLTP